MAIHAVNSLLAFIRRLTNNLPRNEYEEIIFIAVRGITVLLWARYLGRR